MSPISGGAPARVSMYPDRTRPELTEADIARLRAEVPDSPVRLQSGWVACEGCGVAQQAEGARLITVETATRTVRTEAGGTAYTGPTELTFTRCPDCGDRARLAAAITAAHPAAVRALGTAIAPERIAQALDVLAVLGQPLPAVGITDSELAVLVRHLGLSASVRWITRFAPVMGDTRPGTCSPRPWAHVGVGTRRELGKAWAAVLAERVHRSAPPMTITPPPLPRPPAGVTVVPVPGGCLFCGVASLTVPVAEVNRLGGRPQAQLALWTTKIIPTEALGGPRSPDKISGHVCPACAEAIERAGRAVGQTAMIRAASTHLRASGQPDQADKLRGEELRIPAWAALVFASIRRGRPTPEPNAEPWAHLDLSEITPAQPMATVRSW